MNTKTQTACWIRAIVLGLAVAAFAVPAAQANHDYGDAFARSLGNTVDLPGYPDAVDRAALNRAAQTSPDAFERAVRNGVGGQAVLDVSGNAYPDAFDRALRNGPTHVGSLDEIELIRSQPRVDVPVRGLDLIEQVGIEPRQTTTPSTVSTPGFDWADAGIGAGLAFGALLLAAAAAIAVRGRSRVVHP